MQRTHLWGLAGVLAFLAVVLAGCSLLFPPQAEEEAALEVGIAASEGWLLAAQGEDAPAACEQDLSRSEARQEAKEALREDEEAQELKQVLASLGKRLMVWRAKGCEVSTEEDESDEGDASGQGLFAQQQGEEPETILGGGASGLGCGPLFGGDSAVWTHVGLSPYKHRRG